ncbi:MAG: PGF-pre-PGF domain-containing protein [Methanococcoides sp.]|nr:PGF-pre-PGF domain-containing protein [Methanococcoides sp.]
MVTTATVAEDTIYVEGPVYNGTDFHDIVSLDNSDFVEMNASNFAGFIQGESLRIYGGDFVLGRTIQEEGLVYETRIEQAEYESSAWEGETYPIMGFFGNEYVPLKDNPDKLARLILNNNNQHTLHMGDKLNLGWGYALELKQIDAEGDKATIEFTKDGILIERKVIAEESTWISNQDVAGENNVEVLRVHVTDVFQGQIFSLIIIEGIWLIDYQEVFEINADDEFGVFEIDTIDVTSFCLMNYDPITLIKNSTQELVEGLEFKVMDSDDFLTFYLLKTETIPPIAYFMSNVTSGDAPLVVQFTDESTNNPTSWEWDFGDGSVSNEQNPVHVYTAFGSYNVSLTVSNDYGNDTELKKNYITATALTAEFTANITSGDAPLVVQFTDESTNNPTSWEWDFGDGSVSNEQNPVHVYNVSGTYDVSLTVSNDQGNDTESKADYIVLTPLTADFTANVTSGDAPLAVQFTDESISNPTSWEWDFGDGYVSNEQNPVHIYTELGYYTVNLTIGNGFDNNTVTKIDYIKMTEDSIFAKGPVYSATNLHDIVGFDNSDFVEMNASNFAGLVSAENLKVYGGDFVLGRTIQEEGLVYETQIEQVDFESDALGDTYNVMGFFGDVYVPLKSNTPDKLARLLIDCNEKYILRTGDTLYLGDGYAITPSQIDVDGDKVWMEFSKDGEFIDDHVIEVSAEGATWVFDTDVAGESDAEVLRVHVTNVFLEDNLAVVEGIWLIDFQNVMEVKSDDEFGVFEVVEISNRLVLKNYNPVTLTSGSAQELAEELKFKVEDSNEYLIFYLTNEPTGPIEPKTIYVDDDGTADYATITEAVYNANDEDTIIVYNGTYVENVFVNKELTIISQSGNPNYTIVQAANSNDHVFHVTKDNVTISGFNATGAMDAGNAGIYLYEVKRCIVTNNKLPNNWFGIWLDGSSNNILSNNTASSNSNFGIGLLNSSNNNTLSSNIVSNNSGDGIYLENTSNSLTYNNYFNNTNNVQYNGTNTGNNIWNITQTVGTNIVGGPLLGGNYWVHPNGTGFSVDTADSNKDGICDEQYNLSETEFDYLPLALLSGSNNPPSATIVSISPNPYYEDGVVIFNGSGTDVDGTIIGYNWTSSIDGQLSTSANFSTYILSLGTRTIYFSVQDNDGAWSDTVSATLEVIDDTAPDVNISATPEANISVNNPVTIALNSSDKHPKFTELIIANSEGDGLINVTVTDKVVSGSTFEDWNATFSNGTAVPSGTYVLSVKSTDTSGNEASASVNVTVDNTAPLLYIIGSEYNETHSMVNISASESINGTPEIEVNSEAISVTSNGNGWSGIFSLNGNEVFAINVTAYDFANNVGVGNSTIHSETIETADNSTVFNSSQSGISIIFRTTNATNSTVIVTESDQPMANVTNDYVGIYFIDVDLGSELEANFSSATIMIPTNVTTLPSGFNEDDVVIYYYNETNDTWEPIATSIEVIDAIKYWVAHVDHFSTYAAMAEIPSSTDDGTEDNNGNNGGGGGGSGATGEAFENIALKNVKTEDIVGGLAISYIFDEEQNAIQYINFSALRNYGRVSTTIEVLKNRSAMVDESAPGVVYSNLNIWVGRVGFATEDNIADPVIGFSVAKAWVTENGIDENSIALYRHSEGKWNALNTMKVGEDDSYIYFEAETPGFSPFAITGQKSKMVEEVPEEVLEEEPEHEVPEEEPKGIPWISTGSLILMLVGVHLLMRKRS